jgi:hypothetical protein
VAGNLTPFVILKRKNEKHFLVEVYLNVVKWLRDVCDRRPAVLQRRHDCRSSDHTRRQDLAV